jgi:hypothetical protein
MTEVFAVKPAPDVGEVLIDAHFIDAYRVSMAAADLDATDAARSMLAHPPAWIDALMALRHALVTPFGLKTRIGPEDRRERIGIFPIDSATHDRAVLGFDDQHLDFRLVVDVARAGGFSEVTATTLVRLNNRLGRAYLATILPFHKLIVRSMLSRVGRDRRAPIPG